MTHHHHHNEPSSLTFEEKLNKILQHWKKHNDDHAATYDDWAAQCEAHNLVEVGELLQEVARMTRQINQVFDNAKSKVQGTAK